MVRPQGHEPKALADEVVARTSIARTGSYSERAFVIPLER